MPTNPQDVKFIGISLEDAMRVTSEQARTGRYFDGTAIPPEVRDAMTAFVKALEAPARTRARNYFFVWSTHIFANVEHDILSG